MKRLDLRKDFADVYAYLSERVRAFDPATNDGPGKGKRVTAIEVGFGLFQSGWVCVVFDTRRNPEPDGEWTMHIDENVLLERPRWPKACDALERHPLTVIRPDATEKELPAGKTGKLAAALVDLLRAVLFKARADGLFASLPKAARCEMGAEELESGHGWPKYEDRGKKNLA